MPDEPFDLPTLIRALEEHGVRYVVIGGVAMTVHGSAHVTFDIDVAYERSRQNLAALAHAMQPLHPKLRGVPDDVPFVFDERTLVNAVNLTLDTSLGKIDLLGDVPGATFAHLEAHRQRFEISGIEVEICSLDDLIAMKRAAGRTKDRVHLLELEALRKMTEGP